MASPVRIVGGSHRGRVLKAPPGDATRPTGDRTREALFNILEHGRFAADGSPLAGGTVLDVFAGTGALGLEALSRGASNVVFVDNGAEARGLIRDHIEGFGLGGVTKLLRRDATDLGPAGTMRAFDLIFLDPPYGQGLSERALVSCLDGNWIASDATIVLEEGRDVVLDLPPGFIVEDRRDYGAAAVYFITVQPA
jgi:16S rRNA (guanine966-N2)-methyltransferase